MKLNRIFDAFLLLIAAIVSYCYVICPITNDARIYLGVEHIAAQYYPFPQSIDMAWEIKPVFNRLLNYALYQGATLFVPFENHYLFGIAIKLLTLAFVIAVAWYVSQKVAVQYSFYLIFFTFTTMANFCILQAEYWGVLFAVLAIGLLLSRSLVCNALAGVLMTCTVFLKGITGLLIVVVLCGWYLLETRRDEIDDNLMIVDQLKMFIAGMLATGYAFCVMGLLYWPNMISDMLMSAQLARVGQAPWESLAVWFVAQGITATVYIPVLVIGFIFGALFFFAWVRYQDTFTRYAYDLMWIVPAVIVLVQGELFSYHYLAFVPAAIVTVLLCERYTA